MATANSTHYEHTSPYSAPSPSSNSSLATLIRALGDLKVTGHTVTDKECRHTWNTDPESLQHLETHAHDARLTIGLGLAGIGNLLCLAAGNEDAGNIDRDTLMNTGALIQYLAESLIPLAEFEYCMSMGKADK